MQDRKIEELRDKLNQAILEKKSYREIYEISIALDELIAKYYRENEGKKIDTIIIEEACFFDENVGSIAKFKEESLV